MIVESVDQAVDLCNRYSPHFVASLISEDPDEHRRFYANVDAPFVGTGFTRWVDGQYALNAPELGLSNWQHGRTLGRGAILSGDSVFTVRYRADVVDHHRPPVRSGTRRVLRVGYRQTPVMSTIRWVGALVVTHTAPLPSSLTLVPLATAPNPV